jgi:uncharacterized phage protein gp47/JayE
MNRSSSLCTVPIPPTPEAIHNRPGLEEIDYRVGTYATFRRAMIESIADNSELRDWTTRESEDFGIALLEMWAYLADILTFYQERIANEAYLRTAVHEDTVRRLAAQLDYEPAPGAAAEALFAFTLEDDTSIRIPERLRVQSVPGQDEEPQKFETVETIPAHDALNAAPVFPVPTGDGHFSSSSSSQTHATLDPKRADSITELVNEGDALVLFDVDTATLEEKKVKALRDQPDGRVELEWAPAVQADMADLTDPSVDKYERTVRPFGYDAPTQYVETKNRSNPPPGVRTKLKSINDADFEYMLGDGSGLSRWIALDDTYDSVKSGDRLLVWDESGKSGLIGCVGRVREQSSTQLPDHGVNEDLVRARSYQGAVTQVRLESISGSIPNGDRRSTVVYLLSDPEISLWELRMPDEENGPLKDDVGPVVIPDPGLDRETIQALQGREVFLVDGETRESVAVEEANSIEKDGISYVKLFFEEGLEESYTPGEAELYGNVAPATHGETVADEVLGSGDASAELQSFKVQKSPVTYVRDPSAPEHGVRNTLQVRVDGVEWTETDRLYGQGGSERVYSVSVDPDGTMWVQFGGGEMGARLPTGSRNVRATYRTGLGDQGNVDAHTLETPLDRPKGLSGVTNPRAAKGGEDPEGRESTRSNAPNTVRTFDRIVSLLDFEDAARAYTSVSKARAHSAWTGTQQGVHLTVAGSEGHSLGEEQRDDLRRYLDEQRDPHQGLEISEYEKVTLQLTVTIEPHDAHREVDVKEAVRAAVLDFFAFENRALGQSVNRSDLYRRLQSVEGVVAARIDQRDLTGRVQDGGHTLELNEVGRLSLEPNQLATLIPADSDAMLEIQTRDSLES